MLKEKTIKPFATVVMYCMQRQENVKHIANRICTVKLQHSYGKSTNRMHRKQNIELTHQYFKYKYDTDSHHRTFVPHVIVLMTRGELSMM